MKKVSGKEGKCRGEGGSTTINMFGVRDVPFTLVRPGPSKWKLRSLSDKTFSGI